MDQFKAKIEEFVTNEDEEANLTGASMDILQGLFGPYVKGDLL